MTDYKLPELPSDEELGITDEDLRALEDEPPASPPGNGGAPPPPPAKGRPKAADTHDEGLPRWRGPVTLLALIAVGWFASIRTGLPQVVPGDAADTAFSAARAMSVLDDVARAPRPTGSPEHARVRADLIQRLRALGLEPELQVTTAMIEGPDYARAATVRNVMARVPGADPTGAVLITAHYDAAELSPGAGDDASGVVTALETLRAVLAAPPLRNDVIVLFTDAEELGLLGAEAFVAEHPWSDDVSVVLSFEMRGSTGPSILFETGEGNGFVLRALRSGYPDAFGSSLGDELFRYMPYASDFTVLEHAGKQGLNFAAIDNASVYHTPRDVPSALSGRTLQHHGMHALGALRALGSADLSNVRSEDVVYFSLPGVGLVVYPESWVRPLTGILIMLALGTLFLAVRRGARIPAMLVGSGVSVVAASLGYGAGILLVDQVRSAHLEAGRLPAALFYGEGWYVLAMAAAALLIVLLLRSAIRARVSVAELTFGALVIPLAGAVAVTFVMPLAAMELQWPVFATLLTLLMLALLGPRADSFFGWIVSLVFAAGVFVFLVPGMEFLWLAGTLRLSGALGAAMVLGFLMVLPIIDHLRWPNAWWAPLLALLSGTGFVGMARLGSDVSAVTPIPTTLAYAYEHGDDEGLWITDSNAVSPSAPEAAVAWLSARVGSPFDRTVDLSDVGYLPGATPVAAGPPASAPMPSMTVQGDTTVGALRRVTLAVRSRIGAERIYFRRTGGAAGTRIASVNGRRLSDPFAVRWVDHWGVPEQDVVLELEMPAGSEVDLVISEHHLRPEEILGPGTFQRPPGLEAAVLRWSDRAILTTRLGGSTPGDPGAAAPAMPMGTPGEPTGEPIDSLAVRADSPAVRADSGGNRDSTVVEEGGPC
jgi:hypothetical protein